MSVRIVLAAAVAIAAAIAAVWLLSGRAGDRTPATAGGVTKPGVHSDGGAEYVESRDRPSLRGVEGTLTGSGPRPQLRGRALGVFESEIRDPSWADKQEKSVRARVDNLLAGITGVRVSKLECRSARCSLLVVATDAAGLRRFMALLEDERGFYKRAKQLVMHDYRPAKNAKDESSLGVLLEYAR